jgi:hypothetical protein
VGIVILIACDQLGEKKQAEVANNQHVGPPRSIIHVGCIIAFEIATQMLSKFLYHYKQVQLLIGDRSTIRAVLLCLKSCWNFHHSDGSSF